MYNQYLGPYQKYLSVCNSRIYDTFTFISRRLPYAIVIAFKKTSLFTPHDISLWEKGKHPTFQQPNDEIDLFQ